MKSRGIGEPRVARQKAIDNETDPYLMKKGMGPAGISVCEKCGAVYHEKRWIHSTEVPGNILAEKEKTTVLCPACRKIRDKFAEGYVIIQGDFLKGHRDEIINLVKNKEEHAMHFNPLDRIIEIKEREGEMEVTTTTENLAQRIGQILEKSYDGQVEYKWSDDVKLARVVWKRP